MEKIDLSNATADDRFETRGGLRGRLLTKNWTSNPNESMTFLVALEGEFLGMPQTIIGKYSADGRCVEFDDEEYDLVKIIRNGK